MVTPTVGAFLAMNNPSNRPLITTDRTNLTILQPSQALLMQTYYVLNWRFLKPWEPTRSDAFFSLHGWQGALERYNRNFDQGTAINFAALNLANDEVIGVVNFSNIVHGPFQACHLGYSLAEKYQGQGLMFEILDKLISYVFNQYHLHRIMANHLPDNIRSEKLLKRLGFEKEGYAKSYLQIDGKWQDHVLNSRIND
ncbi:MAG: ribosomal-protein-alanine N-acetyltransferase [Phenylobacterium sp.]|jgi:ribosomal-protein-alanine N-acetyltransferase